MAGLCKGYHLESLPFKFQLSIVHSQVLQTKIKLLGFLLRSSRRTLIFSQASPTKVKTIPNIFLYSIYVKEGFEIFMLEVIVVITICLNHSITETIMLGISMAC